MFKFEITLTEEEHFNFNFSHIQNYKKEFKGVFKFVNILAVILVLALIYTVVFAFINGKYNYFLGIPAILILLFLVFPFKYTYHISRRKINNLIKMGKIPNNEKGTIIFEENYFIDIYQKGKIRFFIPLLKNIKRSNRLLYLY